MITLTPGATFGELCLIEPDSKRSATVIVDPQAQMANFIVLTAASYLRMTRSQTIEVSSNLPSFNSADLEVDIVSCLEPHLGNYYRQYCFLTAFTYL